MMRPFVSFIAALRYFFILAVLALAALALGSLARGVYATAELALGRSFALDPGGGAAVVPYFVRAAFLYFLAVALASLFIADVPAPQWMTVRNLFQFRNKVLVFVSVILPLGFMGRMMGADALDVSVLYSGAGVFLVLAGIFLLTRFGAPSGDEGMSREGNQPYDGGARSGKQAGRRDNEPRRKDEKRRDARQGSDRTERDERQRNEKEDLRFQKESLEKAMEKDIAGDTGGRENGNVTVRPGPRRPRRRR